MPHPWARLALVLALAGSTIACDRVSKELALRALAGRPRHSYAWDTVRLEYVENQGAFLSLGAGLPDRVRTPLLGGANVVLLAGLAVVLARRRFRMGWSTSGLCLIWAGGASNLVDRLTRGSVVDFLNVGIGPVRTGIFNVADVAVMAGLGLYLLGERSTPRDDDGRAALPGE